MSDYWKLAWFWDALEPDLELFYSFYAVDFRPFSSCECDFFLTMDTNQKLYLSIVTAFAEEKSEELPAESPATKTFFI